MSQHSSNAEKILANTKGLRSHLQAGEEPILSIPGYWDNGRQSNSIACDSILTNQRLFGYYLVTFPRERLFLDAISLAHIRTVSLRKKNFEPLFQELQVSTGDRTVYIRAPRKKIEALFATLQSTLQNSTPSTATTVEQASESGEHDARPNAVEPQPTYTQQEIRRPFEGSPAGITLLMAGGIFCEVVGILLWYSTRNAQIGVPLILAGLVAWGTSILLRRQRH